MCIVGSQATLQNIVPTFTQPYVPVVPSATGLVATCSSLENVYSVVATIGHATMTETQAHSAAPAFFPPRHHVLSPA